MSYSYIYNKHVVDMLQFDNYIKDFGFETFQYAMCEIEIDNLILIFSNELSVQERKTLKNAVDSFTEVAIDYEANCYNILTSPKSTNNTQWTIIASWNYPGYYSLIYKALHINSMILRNSDVDTYSIRIFDASRNVTMYTLTASNSDLEMHMGDIDSTKLPTSISNIELHAKVSSPQATVTIKNFCITS